MYIPFNPMIKRPQMLPYLYKLSLWCNSLRRTYACASTAVDALISVDYIDITCRNSLYWALSDTCTTCNARI